LRPARFRRPRTARRATAGILLDNQVGRFVADAEAIYSYEGTREINTLIHGRAITGLSVFV
jgi:glutaryl-CoA dehydrogenase